MWETHSSKFGKRPTPNKTSNHVPPYACIKRMLKPHNRVAEKIFTINKLQPFIPWFEENPKIWPSANHEANAINPHGS